MQFEKGIELLNQTEIMELACNLFLAIFAAIVVFIIFVLIGSISGDAGGIVAGIFLGIFAFCMIAAITESEIPTGKYQYQVTIDDSISLTDFYEKYDIIEQNGKIYTIELKEE